MSNKMVRAFFLVIFVGSLTACGTTQLYHEYLARGQVVGVDSNEVVVCIGSSDGAKVGQGLQVYRYIWEGAEEEGNDDYRKEFVGNVEITTIVNEHFARAKVSAGDVRKHDMVELKK
ncbi:hypothetical protein [uncultured Pseudoteredinibacter sp.]|uniref:hypothetical protein n=1 Tax=uncultured Pseudoteredinibacter sp. TaxID=1641701 RepID=UPI00261C51AF|nr:hypothetical protein [uncultured Pseudoteredinibacter sp.]